jgi:hypothetical protein
MLWKRRAMLFSVPAPHWMATPILGTTHAR